MVSFRPASAADVAAMAACRSRDPQGGPADERMGAYFRGEHHPHLALPPRTGFVALANDAVVGYIAGHLTTRHDCQGEVQYLFVSSEFRRQGIARRLIQLMAA
jgi:ribosomal protein S18 acetylase RimI-like enzyme